MGGSSYDEDVLAERIIAQLVDGVIMVVLALVLIFGAFGLVTGAEAQSTGDGLVGGIGVGAFFVALLSGFAYSAGLEHYWDGQTVGKKLMDIRVRDASGGRASAVQTAVRNVPAIINLGLLSVIAALLAIAVTDRNQRIFDAFASTVVVADGADLGGAGGRQDAGRTQF